MVVWKSSLRDAEQRFATAVAALKQSNDALREQLTASEHRYTELREDLRLAVGLKQRTVYVPASQQQDAVDASGAPQQPKWAAGANTPRDFKRLAETEAARKFAEGEAQAIQAALRAAGM